MSPATTFAAQRETIATYPEDPEGQIAADGELIGPDAIQTSRSSTSCGMPSRLKFFFRAIYILLAGTLLLDTAQADEGTLRLTAELKEDLAALPRLVETRFDRDSLDDKHVVVTFFASWCPPCREEFKELNRFLDTNESKQVTILAINLFEDWFGVDEARLQRFLKTYSPRFHVVKGNEEVKRAFNNVNRIPTMFVFNPAGDMVEGFVHRPGAKKQHVTAEELRDMLRPHAEQSESDTSSQ